jgi:hypothetical protein
MAQGYAQWRNTLIVGLALALGSGIAPAAARTNNRLKVVVVVHGFGGPSSSPGRPCDFEAFIDYFIGKAWANTFDNLKYYPNDGDCPPRGTLWNGKPRVENHDISTYGPNDAYAPPGTHTADGIDHTDDASINHLAQHLAWYIHDTYTEVDRTVDVAAHSMGGLIVRRAIDGVQRGERGFPLRLLIEDVITMGTPHNGTWSAWVFCVGSISRQCDEMQSTSDFMNYLRSAARNPQGQGGTQWSLVGSDFDPVVPGDSAAGIGSMDVRHRVRWQRHEGIHHGEDFTPFLNFLHDDRPSLTADAWVWDGSRWTGREYFYYPLRYADLALTFGDR